MKLSDQLKQDNNCGDFGNALNGYAERVEVLEDAIFKHGIEITRLILRAESLERGYDEIVEIYANMEGFIPETAPEGYQQKIIRDMYEAATKYTWERYIPHVEFYYLGRNKG